MNLKSLANHLGLSTSTVSRVLAGRGDEIRIAKSTQARILAAAAETGAEPNALARGLRVQKTRAIGLLVPDISNPFFAALARSVEEPARNAGYAVLLADARESETEEAECVRLLSQRRMDGLIVAPVGGRSEHLEALKAKGVPMVQVDRVFDSLGAPSVVADNFEGARRAVKHLVERGHRAIACLQGSSTSSANAERVRGYRAALAEANIPFRKEWLTGDEYSTGSGMRGAGCLLALERRPTAILAMGNLLALGALEAIRRRKLVVPGDVALVTFDDAPWAPLLQPSLSVVLQPVEEMGRRAARELLSSLAGAPVRPAKKIVLRTRLIVRDSS